jgi:GNAT superfamily N-acetyltransferase
MGYKYPVDQTKIKLEYLLKSDKDKIFVATVQDIVVGYIHANDYDLIYAPHMKNIMGIAVSSEYKKQGIGKAMLTEVEKWAKETGALGVRLVSGSTRIGAHEFYRRCGYDGGKQQLNFKKYF